MHVYEILSPERVLVDAAGERVTDKAQALRALAELIAPGLDQEAETIAQLLLEREELQSTGIGEGVAIPHTSIPGIRTRVGALLLCRRGVEFDSIDNAPASIILGVVGPKEQSGEHLKVLARASRLLRDASTRSLLLDAPTSDAAFQLIEDRCSD